MDRDNVIAIIVFSILFMMSGLFLFLTGFHNLDTGQNMRYLETKWHVELVDIPIYGNNTFTSITAYIDGAQKMFFGMAFMFMAGFLPLVALTYDCMKK